VHILTADDLHTRFVNRSVHQLFLTVSCFLVRGIGLLWRKLEVEDDPKWRPKDEVHMSPQDMSFLKKFWWCVRFFFAFRGIGWGFESNKTYPARDMSRTRFILWSAAQLVFFALTNFAVGGYLVSMDDANWNAGTPVWRRMLYAWSGAYCILSGVKVLYSGFSVFFCTLGVWANPKDWKPVFGNLSDATSTGNVWSKVWHQYMRLVRLALLLQAFIDFFINIFQFLALPGDALLSELRISHKSFFGRNLRRFLAFATSGFVHTIPILVFTNGTDGGFCSYFLLQFLAMLIEDIFWIFYTKFSGRDGKEKNRPLNCLEKVGAYIWTFGFFSIVNMWIFDANTRLARTFHWANVVAGDDKRELVDIYRSAEKVVRQYL
jgi:hypothetical protein